MSCVEISGSVVSTDCTRAFGVLRGLLSTVMFIEFILVWFGIAALAGGTPLSDVLSAAMEAQNSIQSYEFSGTYLNSGKLSSTLSSGVARRIWFRQSGDMFRMESHPLNPKQKGKSIELTSAYNGSLFQQFYPDQSMLTYSGRNRFPSPYIELNPITIPFFWLFDTPFQNWATTQLPERWKVISNTARLVGRETVRSMECDVVAIKYPSLGPEAALEVCFAEQLGYYPIQVRSIDVSEDQLEKVEIEVVRSATLMAEGRPIAFPTHIKFIEVGSNGELNHDLEWKLEPASIRINCEFPDEIFTLSPSMAKVVDDYDHNMKRLLDRGLIKPVDLTLTSVGGTNKWLLVNLVAVLVLTILVVARRLGFWGPSAASESK